MNNKMDRPEETGEMGKQPHIWLRYATQFTTGGRTHSIEMGIPVPPGASAEVRAQLIREAAAGMDQLASHVENRVNQMLQRSVRPQSTTSSATATATPMAAPASRPASRPPTAVHAAPSHDVASEETQKLPAQDKEVVVPPTRTSVGASMPVAPKLQGDANGNLKLTQFLQIIRETMGLTSQQAKELLQVPTLNDLNLRDALERLQHIVAQKASGSASSNQKQREGSQLKTGQKSSTPPQPAPAPSAQGRPQGSPLHVGAGQAPAVDDKAETAQGRPQGSPLHVGAGQAPAVDGKAETAQGRPQGSPLHVGAGQAPAVDGKAETPPVSSSGPRPPIDLTRRVTLNDKRPGYRFDEEDEEDEISVLYDGDDEGEHPGLTAEERLRARDLISKLQGVRGASSASQGRLTVLHNVVSSQISDGQLRQLLQGLWDITTEKKLKADQVEELISWAKEDDFADEVDAVLTLLEEE